MTSHILFPVVAAAFAVAAPLAAQGAPLPMERSGFTASIGAGAGSARLSCATCASGQSGGPAVTLRLGRGVGASLVVAGEASAWRKRFVDTRGDATTTLTFANMVVQWYPHSSSGLYLKGGGGVSRITSDADLAGFGNTTVMRTGAGAVIGAGWDLPAARSVVLTLYSDLNFGPRTDSRNSVGVASPRLGGRLIHAGIAVGWR